ncbi:unnamed protein product [Lactuca virosa]|uniref:Exocyst complex subunit Exo70 C-terminal domain-containing protein n=1 Tax=Lactuca virosa TaxID=75947 RepID=A0AAU9PSX5_9ASTR|nr:unnamed protein product [Lactuca virosa]
MGIKARESSDVGRLEMRSGREDTGPATIPTVPPTPYTSQMDGLKELLLPPKPASAIYLRDASYRPYASGHQPFQGVDVLCLKKCGQGLPSWIRVHVATGDSQVIEVEKFTIMRRCDLPARDLRLLDPLFVYPSTIIGREKAIVVNLEHILFIIPVDEVLLLNSLDSYVSCNVSLFKACLHRKVVMLVVMELVTAVELHEHSLKIFNGQFEELHQRQSQWTVPDTELRESLRLAVAEVLLPAYKSFIKRVGHLLRMGRIPTST